MSPLCQGGLGFPAVDDMGDGIEGLGKVQYSNIDPLDRRVKLVITRNKLFFSKSCVSHDIVTVNPFPG